MKPEAVAFARRLRSAVVGIAGLAAASFGTALPPPQQRCTFEQIHVGPQDEVVVMVAFGDQGKALYRRASDRRDEPWHRVGADVFHAAVDAGRHGLYAWGDAAGLFHSLDGREWHYRGPARPLRAVDRDGVLYACGDRDSVPARSEDAGQTWVATAPAPGGCSHMLSAAGRLFAFGEETSDLAVSEDRGATWRRVGTKTQGGASFKPRWRVGQEGGMPTLFVASDGSLFLNQPEGRFEPQILRLRSGRLDWEVLPVAWPDGLEAGNNAGIVEVRGDRPLLSCAERGADGDRYRLCSLDGAAPRPIDTEVGGCRDRGPPRAPVTRGARSFRYSDTEGLCVRERGAAPADWQPMGARGLPDTSRFDCRIREQD